MPGLDDGKRAAYHEPTAQTSQIRYAPSSHGYPMASYYGGSWFDTVYYRLDVLGGQGLVVGLAGDLEGEEAEAADSNRAPEPKYVSIRAISVDFVSQFLCRFIRDPTWTLP